MKTSTIPFILSVLASFTSAQTPSNFSIQTDKFITVTFESSDTTVKTGTLYSQADVSKPPTVFAPKSDYNGLYVVIMVDATYPFLHVLEPNMAAKGGNGELSISSSGNTSLVGAAYIQPAPPKGDPPHTYTVLLYEQPEGWTIPSTYDDINPRTTKDAANGFNVTAFVTASGLTDLVGANNFRVEPNGVKLPTTASPTSAGAASATAASSSASASAKGSNTNAASGVERGSLLWLFTSLLLWRAF